MLCIFTRINMQLRVLRGGEAAREGAPEVNDNGTSGKPMRKELVVVIRKHIWELRGWGDRLRLGSNDETSGNTDQIGGIQCERWLWKMKGCYGSSEMKL